MNGRDLSSCGRRLAGALFLAALALAPAATAQRVEAAPLPGVQAGEAVPADLKIMLGDRVEGTLQGEQTHTIDFDAVEGTRITVRVSRKAGTGIFGFSLIDPDGETIYVPVETVKGPKLAKVKRYTVEKTGTWRIVLQDQLQSTTSTSYFLRLFRKFDQRFKTTVVVDGETEPNPVLFDALPGTMLRKIYVTSIKPKGKFQKVGGKPADLRPEVTTVIAPESGAIPVDGAVQVSPSGKKVWAKKILLPEFGTYSVLVDGADGTVGYAKVFVQLRFPKGGTVHQLELD